MIWIWFLNYDRILIQSLTFYMDFEAAKIIHVLEVLIWGFGRYWKFLTWVWHLDVDLDLVTGLWYTNVLNFGSLSWFWRCKKHSCPLSPFFWFWRMLEDPDWGLASWSLFEYGHCSQTHPSSECPSGPDLGLWRMLDFCDWELAPWSCFWYGHWALRHPCSEFQLFILRLKVQRTSYFLSPD